MGARSKNFYNDFVKRLGYEDVAVAVQDHFLAGRRKEAEAAIPDALIDELCLVGEPERIRDRLEAWKAVVREGKISSLVVVGATVPVLRTLAEAAF